MFLAIKGMYLSLLTFSLADAADQTLPNCLLASAFEPHIVWQSVSFPFANVTYRKEILEVTECFLLSC
jgi:hypothetical protein